MKTILITLFLTVISINILAQDQIVNGNLVVNNKIKLGYATDKDNASPGLVGVFHDDFLYKGKYLNHYGLGFYQRDAETDLRAYFSGYFGIDLFTRGEQRLTILNNGNVGIGTITPSAKLVVNGAIKGNKLDINGTIRAKEVKIEATGWADFVFREDYRLPDLSEVENHIKEKGTLPDIPSEEDVKKDGIDIGEMQIKLLQKIEELTLYTIRQQKQLEEQAELIRQLRQRIDNE